MITMRGNKRSRRIGYHPMTKKQIRELCSMEIAGEGYKVGQITIEPGSKVYYRIDNNMKTIMLVEK